MTRFEAMPSVQQSLEPVTQVVGSQWRALRSDARMREEADLTSAVVAGIITEGDAIEQVSFCFCHPLLMRKNDIDCVATKQVPFRIAFMPLQVARRSRS